MAATPMDEVRAVMARLRDPDTGCPWDLKQNFASIAPHTIEEAYEVADAIARDDHDDLLDELGDLLLQVVFHSQMAAEQSLFDFDAVCVKLAQKLVHRHPHVFGELAGQQVDVATVWEAQKRAERGAASDESALDHMTVGLPALRRAQKLQQRAARVGFDWPEVAPVMEKLSEELAELQQACAEGGSDAIRDELGDLLFSVVNLSRHLEVDAESALSAASGKFERRFRALEQDVRSAGKQPAECTLEELDHYWDGVKSRE